MDHIVAKRSDVLTKERVSLLYKLGRIDIELESARGYKAARSELHVVEKTLAEAHTRLNSLRLELDNSVECLRSERDRLPEAKASGFFKRLLSGLNPKQIEASIRKYENQTDAQHTAFNGQQERIGHISRELAQRIAREQEAARIYGRWFDIARFTDYRKLYVI